MHYIIGWYYTPFTGTSTQHAAYIHIASTLNIYIYICAVLCVRVLRSYDETFLAFVYVKRCWRKILRQYLSTHYKFITRMCFELLNRPHKYAAFRNLSSFHSTFDTNTQNTLNYGFIRAVGIYVVIYIYTPCSLSYTHTRHER